MPMAADCAAVEHRPVRLRGGGDGAGAGPALDGQAGPGVLEHRHQFSHRGDEPLHVLGPRQRGIVGYAADVEDAHAAGGGGADVANRLLHAGAARVGIGRGERLAPDQVRRADREAGAGHRLGGFIGVFVQVDEREAVVGGPTRHREQVLLPGELLYVESNGEVSGTGMHGQSDRTPPAAVSISRHAPFCPRTRHMQAGTQRFNPGAFKHHRPVIRRLRPCPRSLRPAVRPAGEEVGAGVALHQPSPTSARRFRVGDGRQQFRQAFGGGHSRDAVILHSSARSWPAPAPAPAPLQPLLKALLRLAQGPAPAPAPAPAQGPSFCHSLDHARSTNVILTSSNFRIGGSKPLGTSRLHDLPHPVRERPPHLQVRQPRRSTRAIAR